MKTLLGFCLVLGISGCAAMQESYNAQVCNKEAAYAEGMNDSRAGREMNKAYGVGCPEVSKAESLAGYREGYTAGLASTKESTPVFTINFGNGPNAKAWYCRISAFTKTFDAFGPTELEAKKNATAACKQTYNEMHCNEVACNKNL